MKKKLKEELRKLSTKIITTEDLNDIGGLYETSKELYEKLAVLRFIEEELNDLQVDVSKNAISAKFEEMANAVIRGNTSVPENNPHKMDIITPGMDTIKDMVSEMPSSETVAHVFGDFMAKPGFMKNEKELLMPEAKNTENGYIATASISKSSGPTTDIKVDLNDRLAFVKHLFNDSMEDFNRVLSQLNTIDTKERSVSFIDTMIKPDYGQWQGKEEYELRFMRLIERRFA